MLIQSGVAYLLRFFNQGIFKKNLFGELRLGKSPVFARIYYTPYYTDFVSASL